MSYKLYKITNLGKFYQQGVKTDIIYVTAINIKYYLFAPTKQRIRSSWPCVDKWTAPPITWAAVMFSFSQLGLAANTRHSLLPISPLNWFWFEIYCMYEFDHRILALLKQEQERPGRGFKPWLLRCRCSVPPVELPGQLGAGRYVGRL